MQSTILALMASDLRIVEMLDATFELNLMNRTGNSSDVDKVYATRRTTRAASGSWRRRRRGRPCSTCKTPLMACQLAVEDHGAAAIASETFGAQLGLEVARRNVLDDGGRARALRRRRRSPVEPHGRRRDVARLQRAGRARVAARRPQGQFAERGINLTKIQSHPVAGQTWQYLFYVDMAGHFTDRPLVMAFEEMKRITRFFKVLGSYPAP